ncbi:LysR family transcriptional regulator [Pseudoxanthomonas dokdonensis]|uniref:LysR family transcriptional regulator n=1 Tax=Pseudoxanthomonas dokdonensis TaxID=344882 RepID=A0A0R0CZ24_9GAMM|nr:LysR family transcriptional regulator [Pseudoxanthomonas dokdonensis]KRG71674.1 LysR family transcriptional regulator [Pseudoxanthomonas dokdonensis]
MTTPPYAAVWAFTRVARHASFTRAAMELEVSPSALSQTIRGLEQRMGVRLLQRTTRRVGLTEHGQRFLQQVVDGLGQIDAAFADLESTSEQPVGHLRINLARTAARDLVLPLLPGFMALYPQLQVELYTDDSMADLVAGGFDAGIRLGEALAQGMVAVPISPPQEMVVVATPAYLQRHGTPVTPADLADHDCVRFRLPGSGRLMAWEFSRDGRDFVVEVSGRLIVNDSSLLRMAALTGQTLVQAMVTVVADDLGAGRLQRVLQAYTPPFPGYYLYYSSARQMPRKLRVFIDYLRQSMDMQTA